MTERVTVCAEIMYDEGEGMIHSDLCMIHNGKYEVHDSYREFMHKCLDEWLNNSDGTGMFWIGDPEFAYANFNEGEDNG